MARILTLLALAAALAAPPAFAQDVHFRAADGINSTPVDALHPLPAIDAYDGPFSGAVAMSANTPATAARSIGANCTVSGNLNLTFSDASTLTVPVGVGWQTFPFAVTQFSNGSPAPTCTVVELK